MTAGKISLAPVVEVGGKAMTDEQYDAIMSLNVHRQLGLVGRATLRFEDVGYKLAGSATFTIGQTIKVKQFPSTELFAGTVVGVNLEQARNDQPTLVVVADDDAYKLTRGTTTKTYLRTSYTAAVQQVLSKAGLKPRLTAAAGTQEYLLQAGSDLDFIDSIAGRIGYTWWMDTGFFHFAPAGTSTGDATVVLNEDLHEFSVRASALRPTEVTMSGWSTDNLQTVKGQIEKGKIWTSPSDFVKPYVLNANKIGEAKAGSGELSPLDQTEAKNAAQAAFDESLAASLAARGRAEVNGAIKPATTLKVDRAGPASGSYYVTEVEHIYNSTGFTTRFVAGSLRPSGIVDVLGRPAPDPGLMIQGLVVGVVTDNNDPDKNGRIKVRFAGIPDNVDSQWARVLTTSGGKNRGVVFLPEVDDEVLVGFENSDTRRPVVLGSLFSKQNKLPESGKILGQGKVEYRRITSRLGHIIEFADGTAPAQQHVLVQLGGSATTHKLRLGADNFSLEVAAGKPVTIKAGSASFEINAMGDIAIQGGNINIKATKSFTIEGPKGVIKGTGQLQAQGGQLMLKAMGPGNLEAGGPLSIKGITVSVNQ